MKGRPESSDWFRRHISM